MAVRVFLVEDVPKTQGMLTELLATLGDFRVVGSAGTIWRGCLISAGGRLGPKRTSNYIAA